MAVSTAAPPPASLATAPFHDEIAAARSDETYLAVAPRWQVVLLWPEINWLRRFQHREENSPVPPSDRVNLLAPLDLALGADDKARALRRLNGEILAVERTIAAAIWALRGAGQDTARAGQRKRQALPHVANDELEIWQAIEDSGHDQAKCVQRRFGMPSPTCD